MAVGFSKVQLFKQPNIDNLMIYIGRILKNLHFPGATTCLVFPERGSTALRHAVRPIASILAWIRQADRITFIAQT